MQKKVFLYSLIKYLQGMKIYVNVHIYMCVYMHIYLYLKRDTVTCIVANQYVNTCVSTDIDIDDIDI